MVAFPSASVFTAAALSAMMDATAVLHSCVFLPHSEFISRRIGDAGLSCKARDNREHRGVSGWRVRGCNGCGGFGRSLRKQLHFGTFAPTSESSSGRVNLAIGAVCFQI